MIVNKIEQLADSALKSHETQNYEEAEKKFLEALYLLDNKENELYQLIVYGLGLNYLKQNNFEGARRCFEEGRLNARKAENISHELEMHHLLVAVYRQAGDIEAAKLLSEEEILYRKKHAPNDYEGLAVAYFEASKIYRKLGDTEKYEQAFKDALSNAQKVTDF